MFTTAEVVRSGDIDFSLRLDKLKNFITLKYARGAVWKKNHPFYFCATKDTEFFFSLK